MQQVSWRNGGRLIDCISEPFKFVGQKQAISRAVYFIVDGKRIRRLVMLNYCCTTLFVGAGRDANSTAQDFALVQTNRLENYLRYDFSSR